MLDWLKINKEYPEFWRQYLQSFENKSKRYVVFSTETTGLDPEKDAIISIGCVGVEDNNIVVSDSFDVVIYSDAKLSAEVQVGERTSQAEAMAKFIGYIQNAVLVGHRINFDIEIINRNLDKMGCGRLKNDAIDIEMMFKKWKELSDDKNISLDDLSTYFKIPKNEQNSTSGDAYTISLLFLRLKQRLKL